jgi:hypothetical protein
MFETRLATFEKNVIMFDSRFVSEPAFQEDACFIASLLLAHDGSSRQQKPVLADLDPAAAAAAAAVVASTRYGWEISDSVRPLLRARI